MTRTIALCAITAVLTAAVCLIRRGPAEPRLLGTWQSDGARTVDGLRKSRHLSEEELGKLASIFGKLKVTYTPASYTTELDGVTETNPYVVLGSGRNATVIRDLAPPREVDLGLAEFTVIHFDGPDAYWLDTELGEVREYFHRVSPAR